MAKSDVDVIEGKLGCMSVEDKKVGNVNIDDLGTVIFLGEGNFTFCTAFAIYRGGSWDGIVPTELHLTGTWDWDDTFKTVNDRTLQQYAKQVKDLKTNPPPTRRELDATNMGIRQDLMKTLGIDSSVERLTLWFQCPWYKDTGNVQDLVQKFIESAKVVQEKGEYLLIGVCTIEQYRTQYNLPELAIDAGYSHIGSDNSFVKEMLDRGYKWTSSDDTSPMKLEKHEKFETLIFRKG